MLRACGVRDAVLARDVVQASQLLVALAEGQRGVAVVEWRNARVHQSPAKAVSASWPGFDHAVEGFSITQGARVTDPTPPATTSRASPELTA